MMTNAVPPQTDSLMERILEFSADAQIKRREALPASNTFHHLTGAILAYGKMLSVLTKDGKEQQSIDEHYLVLKPLQAAACAGGPL